MTAINPSAKSPTLPMIHKAWLSGASPRAARQLASWYKDDHKINCWKMGWCKAVGDRMVGICHPDCTEESVRPVGIPPSVPASFIKCTVETSDETAQEHHFLAQAIDADGSYDGAAHVDRSTVTAFLNPLPPGQRQDA